MEFLYCQGRNGWTVDSAAVFQQIVLRYNISLEESQGLRACHLVNHNLTHIHEDVLNFGTPDNYWCYNFERAVQRYVTISNNHKNIEVTFARTELRREILKVRSSLKIQESDSETGICYPKGAHYPSINALESDIQRFTSESKHLSTRNGILVAKLIPSFLPDTSQMNSISEHIRHGSISEVAEECRSIFFTYPAQSGGILFRLGEQIVYSFLPGGE